MVIQHKITDLHVVAHRISRLVVSHPFPPGALLALQVFDGEDVGLALHQPGAHDHG